MSAKCHGSWLLLENEEEDEEERPEKKLFYDEFQSSTKMKKNS
jgi:hypothetical protein